VTVDGEVRAVHAAKIAAATLLRRDHVRRMIAFGIKCRGKRQHLGGTKFHTEPTGLATLNDNGYASFCHEYPHKRGLGAPEVQSALWGACGQGGVMWVTEACEVERRAKNACNPAVLILFRGFPRVILMSSSVCVRTESPGTVGTNLGRFQPRGANQFSGHTLKRYSSSFRSDKNSRTTAVGSRCCPSTA